MDMQESDGGTHLFNQNGAHHKITQQRTWLQKGMDIRGLLYSQGGITPLVTIRGREGVFQRWLRE